MHFLIGCRIRGRINEQWNSMMQCNECFPLRVGQIRKITESIAKFRLALQKRWFRIKEISNRGCIRLFTGHSANQMNNSRALSDVPIELSQRINRCLPKILLNLDIAIGTGQVVS